MILPQIPGPFEGDPKDAIIVGDAEAPEAKKAKLQVKKLMEEAEVALSKISADTQADLSYIVSDYGIADLREATNTIKYLMDDEIPFPVSKKGVVQKRGPARAKRVE